MPRFYFTTADGTSVGEFEGTSLKDGMEARLEAVRIAGQLLTREPTLAFAERDLRVDVSDQRRPAFSIVVTLQVLAMISADNDK